MSFIMIIIFIKNLRKKSKYVPKAIFIINLTFEIDLFLLNGHLSSDHNLINHEVL